MSRKPFLGGVHWQDRVKDYCKKTQTFDTNKQTNVSETCPPTPHNSDLHSDNPITKVARHDCYRYGTLTRLKTFSVGHALKSSSVSLCCRDLITATGSTLDSVKRQSARSGWGSLWFWLHWIWCLLLLIVYLFLYSFLPPSPIHIYIKCYLIFRFTAGRCSAFMSHFIVGIFIIHFTLIIYHVVFIDLFIWLSLPF